MPEVLNRNQLEALLRSAPGRQADPPLPDSPAERAERYDFRRTGRISKADLLGLRSQYDRFARDFASSLSTSLRSLSEASLISLDAMSYAEFINRLPDPTCFHTLELKPGGGSAALELSPELVFASVDRLLGGTGTPHVPSRLLTEVEREVITGVSESALDGLSQIWSRHRPQARFVITSCETSPYLAQPLPLGEQVLMAHFQVVVGDTRGAMNFVCGSGLIDLLSLPRTGAPTGTEAQEQTNDPAMRNALLRAPIELSAELELRGIRLADLLRLEVGDVLNLEAPSDNPALVRLAGKPRLSGRLVSRSKRRAIRLERFLSKEETV